MKKLLITTSLLTLAACSGSDQHPQSAQEGSSSSTRAPLRQQRVRDTLFDEVSKFEPIGKIESELTKFVQRSYGVRGCVPWLLQRIPIVDSIQLIQTIMPESRASQRVTRFISENQSKIIVLLAEARFNDREYAILKINYQKDLYVPHDLGLGCSSGLVFDLTSFEKNPDDPELPPCYFSMGNTGPCCSCVQGYTGQRGCNQSLSCPNGDCCHSDLTDLCIYDQMTKPIELLEYGELISSVGVHRSFK